MNRRRPRPRDAAAGLFATGVAARTKGKVLRRVTRTDLFAPEQAQEGLAPDRRIHLRADDEAALLTVSKRGYANASPAAGRHLLHRPPQQLDDHPIPTFGINDIHIVRRRDRAGGDVFVEIGG